MGTGYEQMSPRRDEKMWFYKYCPYVKGIVAAQAVLDPNALACCGRLSSGNKRVRDCHCSG